MLFEDEGLGNNIAKKIYEDVTGKEVGQNVENVFYRSRAPFWVEIAKNYRERRMMLTAVQDCGAGRPNVSALGK